jgi:hypothetical protein
MIFIAQPEVVESRDDAEARLDLDLWLREWHKANPGQVHALDLCSPEAAELANWDDTIPSPL